MKFIYTLYKCLIFIYIRVNVNVQTKCVNVKLYKSVSCHVKQCKCKIIIKYDFYLEEIS